MNYFTAEWCKMAKKGNNVYEHMILQADKHQELVKLFSSKGEKCQEKQRKKYTYSKKNESNEI